MPSVAIAPAAPVVGAAAGKLAALHATIARLAAQYPPQPPAAPKPAPTAIDPCSTAARVALARTQSVLFDARAAMYAMRDNYHPRPGRFAALRTAIVRYREARAAYAAAAATFHASTAGAALQAARARYPLF